MGGEFLVPSEIFAILLLIASTVSCIMGLQSGVAGVMAKNGRRKWTRLDVTLGLYMLVDGVAYSAIGLRLLRDRSVLPLWSIAIIIAMIIAPPMVFVALANERRRGEGGAR